MTHPAPASLSFHQANAVLENPAVRRAYLIDAVTVGLHMANQAQGRDYAHMLRALMTVVQDDRVYFGVFENERRLAMMCYRFDPEAAGSPVLEETDRNRRSLGPTALTRQLQPVFDHVLAKMEQQVWARVQYDPC